MNAPTDTLTLPPEAVEAALNGAYLRAQDPYDIACFFAKQFIRWGVPCELEYDDTDPEYREAMKEYVRAGMEAMGLQPDEDIIADACEHVEKLDGAACAASGTDGDGVITLVCGAVFGLAVLYARSRGTWRNAVVWGILAALAAGATSIYDLSQIYDAETQVFGENVRLASPGWGIWLVVVASVAMLISAIALWREDMR